MQLFKNSSTVVKNKNLLVALLLANSLFLTGCADEQARSQLEDNNVRLLQLEQTVGVIGNKVSNQKLLDLLNKIDDLQNQINQINGNLATLQNNQQTFQDTQNQLNQGIEQQLQSVGAAPLAKSDASGSVAASATTSAAPISAGSSDRQQLNSALKQIKQRNFDEAIKQLRAVIGKTKDANTLADASYYLAVAYAASGQYKNAMWVSRKFVDANPNNSNVPNALLTLYLSQQQLGMKKSAANTAALLKSKYPNSQAAKKI
jgi:TolA-binding protein